MKIILYQSSPPLSLRALERSGYFPVSAQSANLPTLSALPPDLPRLPYKGKRSKLGGQDPVSDSKSEILNTVHIASSASIFHGCGIPDFGKS